MYCENSNGSVCINKCCVLHTIALAFLAGIFLFLIGLAVGSTFAIFFANFIIAIVLAAIGVLVLFIVTWLTKGCCNQPYRD